MNFAEGRDAIQDITNSIQVDLEERQIWIIFCWLHDFQEKKKKHKKDSIFLKKLVVSPKSHAFSVVLLELSDIHLYVDFSFGAWVKNHLLLAETVIIYYLFRI